MRTPRLSRLAAVALFVTTLSGTAASAAVGAGTPAGAASLPACNLKTLANHKGLVQITFWESASQANLTVLQGITNAFNSSQTKVHVTLVTQAGYDDTWQKYLAGLSSGQLPDVVQLEDQRTQAAIDTGSFLPVQSCMNAAKYPTSDYLPRPLAYWKVNGVQWALPFAVSAPILYFNQNAFTKAGLNPADPPTTLAEMVSDAKALKASGSGMGLVLDPWHLETWLATANQLFVNNKNGRSSRATQAAFNTKASVSIFSQLSTLVRSGDATTNPSTGPDEYDNLLGIGSGKYGMTIETSAALGTVTQLLGSGKYASVKLGIGAFPVYSSSVKGGVEPGGSGRLHLEQGPRAAAGGVVAVHLLSPEHPEPGHMGGRDRLHPGPQVLGADRHGAAPVGHEPRLQGGLRRNQQRRELAGHLRVGDRPLRRRAHRRAQRRDLHVHAGRPAVRRRQVGGTERQLHHFELQQPIGGLGARRVRPTGTPGTDRMARTGSGVQPVSFPPHRQVGAIPQ